MTSAEPRRSTLAMVLLALLTEAPMHPYRMQQMIKQRGQDQLVNVAQRNSVYQALDRLVQIAAGNAKLRGVLALIRSLATTLPSCGWMRT